MAKHDNVLTSADIEKADAKVARIKVFERRLQNPFGEPSAPIDMRDPSLVCRWFNGAIVADKIWRAKNKGWANVRPSDVVDTDQIGGYAKSPEGFIMRGDRGQEVLMSMPRTWRDRIQAAKTDANTRNMGNPSAMKAEVVSAAGDQLGDQAADFINRRVGVVGTVTDTYERVERTVEE